ncbi:ribosomal-protein-alanine acetyltransferase [Burkholderia multivorans CGD1]|nr:ribosomal-protein-alanine acetyltransferase [Burkholderia multivorans CGD1]
MRERVRRRGAACERIERIEARKFSGAMPRVGGRAVLRRLASRSCFGSRALCKRTMPASCGIADSRAAPGRDCVGWCRHVTTRKRARGARRPMLSSSRQLA